MNFKEARRSNYIQETRGTRTGQRPCASCGTWTSKGQVDLITVSGHEWIADDANEDYEVELPEFHCDACRKSSATVRREIDPRPNEVERAMEGGLTFVLDPNASDYYTPELYVSMSRSHSKADKNPAPPAPEPEFRKGELVVCIHPESTLFGVITTVHERGLCGDVLWNDYWPEPTHMPVSKMARCTDVIPECRGWEPERVAELFRDWALSAGTGFHHPQRIAIYDVVLKWGHRIKCRIENHYRKMGLTGNKNKLTFRNGEAISLEVE